MLLGHPRALGKKAALQGEQCFHQSEGQCRTGRDEGESGDMYEVLRAQVGEGLAGVDAELLSRVVIAYEPVWAIGTGKTATNEQAQEAHSFIRGLIMGTFNLEASTAMRILYGGSVKPDNVDALMAEPDVDGALVGGASLKVVDFARIARFKR